MKLRFQIRILKGVAFFHPFFIGLLLFQFPTFASFEYNANVEEAHKEFLKLKITQGQKSIAEALKENPNNGMAYLIANYGDILSLLIGENQSSYNRLKENETIRLKKIASLSTQSPYYLFTQAEIKLQWAFVKLKFGDELSAALSIRQSYKLLEENIKKFPTFLPSKKSFGLMQVALGSLPDRYASAANIIGLKGSIEEGIKNLQEIADSDSPFAFEAKLYLVFVENYILKKSDLDFSELKKLSEQQPDNLLLTFVRSALFLKNASADQALEVLLNRPTGTEYIAFPFLDFQFGDIYLYKGDYLKSRNSFMKFLTSYQGKNFIKDSYYKILLTYWLQNDETNARLYFNKIKESGQTVYDADKHAQKFAEKEELPNKILMKARLNFDGGYYNQALNTLNTYSVTTSNNEKDKIEYYYRKGRLYHAMDNNTQAVLFYMKTIELSAGQNYYFAPNAALQTGYIYKQQNKKELAKNYFNKALTYKDYEYKNSIDNKAKAALNELK